MKKIYIFLLTLGMLAGLVALAAPEVSAAEAHSHHCYCQGADAVPVDHVCQSDDRWEAVNIVSNAISVVDGGCYYLEKLTIASITVKEEMTVTLCLNGFELRAQCPVVVYGGGVLNICDCKGTGMIRATNPNNANGSTMLISSSQTNVGTVNLYGGTVTGITTKTGITCRAVEVKGGIFNMYGGSVENGLSDGSVTSDTKPGYGGNVCVYTNDAQEGIFTMYGGIISGGTARITDATTDAANGSGGNVFGGKGSHIYIHGGTLENGSAVRGGNLYTTDDVTIQGATITGGSADLYRGNVYISGTVDLSKNTITGGTAGGKAEAVWLVQDGVYLVSAHTTLYDALAKMGSDETLQLQLEADLTENRTFSQDIYIDLKGHDLSGITISGKFYGMDSSEGVGKLTCTLEGGQVLGIGEYFPIPEGEGGYSFHSMSATVTHISIHPDKAAMGYKTQLYLADSVLDRVKDFGYDMWLEGYGAVSYAKPFAQCGTELTLRLQNILSSNYTQSVNAVNVDIPVHARPYIILDDGTKISFTEVSYSFHDALEGADDHYSSYTTVQKTALKNLFNKYYYLTKYWHVENFHHIQTGTWSQISSKGVHALIRQGSYNGTYVLTEDVDLGSSTIVLTDGHDLTICLDGHNITGTKQLFRVEGGSLSICDCHYGGNTPGTITGTLAGESGVYAPVAQLTGDGVMNLYGGQLKGQNLVRSAGVVAVGHQTKESNATFNMYGGSISDGQAVYNGGLVNVWHGSTFNLYGGKLYNGVCNGEGGGVVIRDGSSANLYGGEIFDCQSGANGGGIWTSGGAKCYLGNVSIYQNTAAGKGGNVYSHNTADFTLDGAAITGGSANIGGGIFLQNGSVYTVGATHIRDNSATVLGQDLHLYINGKLQADGLTQGADVRVSALTHGKIGTNPALKDYVFSNDDGYSVMENGGDMVLWNSQLPASGAPTDFSAGYGKVCANPKEIDVPLAGYGDTEGRRATEIDGDLYVTATAITDANGQTVLLMGMDISGLTKNFLSYYLPHISYYTGVPQDHIFINCSHTHSAPSITVSDPAIERYKHLLPDLFVQAAIMAMNDREAATMYTGSFDVSGGKDNNGLNFTRHYTYQDSDGIWQYFCDNFGSNVFNDTTRHVTQADPTMHLVKFDREGQDILMINWRAHPTMTGGTGKTVMSSDYVGALREAIEADTGMAAIFFQGAAGNINATSKLSAEKHGLDHHQYGQALCDQIVAAINGGCLTQRQTGLWQIDHYDYTATVDHSDDDRFEEASAFVKEYYEKFPGNNAPQVERLAWCNERGWTCVFEASAIVRRYGKGETEQMSLNTLALGDELAFFTAPGELWDQVSMDIEAASPFATTFCLGYCGGTTNYYVYDPVNFPNASGQLTYASYEGFNHNFVFSTINDMVDYWKEALTKLYHN